MSQFEKLILGIIRIALACCLAFLVLFLLFYVYTEMFNGDFLAKRQDYQFNYGGAVVIIALIIACTAIWSAVVGYLDKTPKS